MTILLIIMYLLPTLLTILIVTIGEWRFYKMNQKIKDFILLQLALGNIELNQSINFVFIKMYRTMDDGIQFGVVSGYPIVMLTDEYTKIQDNSYYKNYDSGMYSDKLEERFFSSSYKQVFLRIDLVLNRVHRIEFNITDGKTEPYIKEHAEYLCSLK